MLSVKKVGDSGEVEVDVGDSDEKNSENNDKKNSELSDLNLKTRSIPNKEQKESNK